MTKDQAFKLWKIYNEKFLELYEVFKFPVINFDLDSNDYFEKLKLICAKLNLNYKADSDFFEKSLIHHDAYSRGECPEEFLPIYDRLLEICI